MSYVVSVRTLCEFAARGGDLDLRFHLAPTGQEGVAGHRIVTARRPTHYQKEVSLQAQYRTLTVRGRADGFDPEARVLEEIKTYRGRLRDMPESHGSLHWAQARLYGHLLCQKLQLDALDLALVYFNITSGRETIRRQHCTATDLEQHFKVLCERFLAWSQQELAHRNERNLKLQTLQLPFEAFRDGQRVLAKAVYRGLRDGVHLAIQAPTGIGKTMGTLFPALKAMPAIDLDKLFFLTAKTSGRGVALQALKAVRGAGPMPLRVIELAAREQACEHPDKQCHGESCPLAKGFYDRLGQAREQILQVGLLNRTTLREHALQHDLCPYHLGAELMPWCDVVVGDYNYYFDKSAMLHTQSVSQEWRTALLVDEAHNLVERARDMYTATLRLHDLQAMLRVVGRTGDVAPVRHHGDRPARKPNSSIPAQTTLWPNTLPHVQAAPSVPSALQASLEALNQNWSALLVKQTGAYQRHPTLPDTFIQSLKTAADALSIHLEQAADLVSDEALHFYFGVRHFLQMAESFGAHSVFETTGSSRPRFDMALSECSIRNLVPAPFLKPRFQTAHACVLFSATLQPSTFYGHLLGLPDTTSWLDVSSPFRPEQLQVRVVPAISTRYADRQGSLAPMVTIIATQYAERPGNYLVFASSFEYLHQLAEAFVAHHPEIATWTQSRTMDNAARAEFLARFHVAGQGVGFAVLGGIFAEGIDLPGERLIGAFIATLGLPQVNPSNETLKQCLDASFAGNGYDYAYLYPGLRKVVQAAGRIIRSPHDTGVIYLMDDRYNKPAVRRLLPPWWRIEQAGSACAVLSVSPSQACQEPAALSAAPALTALSGQHA